MTTALQSISVLPELSLRYLNIQDQLWFAAADVANGIGHSNPSKMISVLRPQERSNFKLERGGSLSMISESGLYFVLLRSDAAIREGTVAFDFRVKVTDEVLPQIRKTGQYQADSTLNSEQQYTLRKAVKSKAKDSSLAYQTIYNALYDYFKVSSYKDLKPSQLQAAITFVDTFSIPALADKRKAELPDGALVLTGEEALRVRNFVYSWRYLFSNELCLILRLLHTLKSPFEARFYEAVTSLNLALLEKTLERHGYPIKGCLTR